MTNSERRQGQEDIDSEASRWVVLAADRPLTPREQRHLEDWLAADPRHLSTWRDMNRTWTATSALTHLAGLAPRPAVSKSAFPRFFPQATAAAALAAFAFVYAPQRLTPPPRYATPVAQTRIVNLPDGTRVTLGPRSSLTVKYSEGERRVALFGGEAFFDVVHNPSRPFFVDAGGAQVRVAGTKFDVNFTDNSVRVAVLEGLVLVTKPKKLFAAGPAVQYLHASQRAEIVLTSQTSSPIAALPATAPGSWREGRLVYENARLADIVADANRYYAPGVILEEPQLGEVRVTASFKPSEIPAFMSAVANVAPVRTEEAANGEFRLNSPSP